VDIIMEKRRASRAKAIRKQSESERPIIFTVGHSTRTQKEFIDLLRAHGVLLLVDIRTIPRSHHNPQFNGAELSRVLQRVGIGYRHMAGLGGLRHSKQDSVNTGWHNKSFRGYADYMQTRQFRTALRTLIALAKRHRVALMCAEAVPWRCHRTLVSDALLVRGFRVEEIQSMRRTRPHALTPWARAEGTRITYPELSVKSFSALNSRKERSLGMIHLKRVYDKSDPEDGKRFLVERLWPRGIKKSEVHFDAWLKDVGPSTALRKWFGHDPKKWNEFRQRYFHELEKNSAAWKEIQSAARSGEVTLVYSSHDTEHNNAVALKEFLEQKLRSPRETGKTEHQVAAA
jgi:uncharacterized protein YeaO (DUF488 family)